MDEWCAAMIMLKFLLKLVSERLPFRQAWAGKALNLNPSALPLRMQRYHGSTTACGNSARDGSEERRKRGKAARHQEPLVNIQRPVNSYHARSDVPNPGSCHSV